MVSPISYLKLQMNYEIEYPDDIIPQSWKVPSAPNDPKIKLNGTTSRSNVIHSSWTTTLESQISFCFVLRSLVFQIIEVLLSSFRPPAVEWDYMCNLVFWPMAKFHAQMWQSVCISETAALRTKITQISTPLGRKWVYIYV